MAKAKKTKSKKQSNSSKKSKGEEQGRNWLSTILKLGWVMLICGVFIAAAIFVLIARSKMPNTEELENPNYEAASILYSTNEVELGRYFSKNRDLVTFEQLNPYLVDALISTEDERYHRHSGIDVKGTIRAVAYLGKKGGASTITQQLAKLFFTNYSRNFIQRVGQKLTEWVIATEFEKRYTKEEILAMYLNKFDYLNDSHGVSAAAQTYFGKKQNKLTLDEAAVLVGMLKNPSLYNPKKKPENAFKRRNVVMYQMVKNGKLSKDEYDQLKKKKIDMSNYSRTVHTGGLAPYFRMTCTDFLKNLLKEKKYLKPDGTKYDIYNDGLKIYTTIDEGYQVHAEKAMRTQMSKIQDKYFNTTWKTRDPWTYTEEKDPAIIKKQIEYRKNYLTRVMRESDRYLYMRQSIMSGIFAEVKDKYPKAEMRDADINRMMKEEREPGYLTKLVRQDYISKERSKVYSQILKDPLWKTLKTQRRKLEEKAKVAFNKKTSMKVFAYNDKGYKTVNWTPMDSIKYHQEHLQIGSVAMEPNTGYIKSWVGGIDKTYFKIDHVGRDNQVGSTFKPFLYASLILHRAISPCEKFQDIKHFIPAGDPNFGIMKTWAPENSDGKYTGESMTMKEALRQSKNSISVALLKELGNVDMIRDLAESMGVEKKKIPKQPSIILGASDLDVLEMTGAYSTFANYGTYIEPTFITSIVDKEGRTIYSAIPNVKKVMNEKNNHAVVELLEYAGEKRLHELKSECGGKTGTTNDFIDGWFMGISPELVIGTWVGGENTWIRFLNIWNGSGGNMAGPFYIDYMKRLENDPKIRLNEGKSFRIPEDPIEMNCDIANKQLPSKVEKDRAVKIKVLNDDAFEDEFNN